MWDLSGSVRAVSPGAATRLDAADGDRRRAFIAECVARWRFELPKLVTCRIDGRFLTPRWTSAVLVRRAMRSHPRGEQFDCIGDGVESDGVEVVERMLGAGELGVDDRVRRGHAHQFFEAPCGRPSRTISSTAAKRCSTTLSSTSTVPALLVTLATRNRQPGEAVTHQPKSRPGSAEAIFKRSSHYRMKTGFAPSAGFEPATHGLGNRRSIP